MNKYQLEVFLIVAQTKKISSAAKLLHLTQPAVSTQIKALESYYKATLFERTKQGVELTAAGEIIYGYAKKILANFEAAEREVDQLLNVDSQSLVIGATQTVGNYAIPCSIWTFKEKYPNSKISLEIDTLQSMLTKLADGQVDIAVLEGLDESDLGSGYLLKNASSDEIILIYPGNDRWDSSFAQKVSLHELISYPFILPSPGLGLREAFSYQLLQHQMSLDDFSISSELGSIESIKNSVQAGFGFSICSRMAVQKELRQGTIKELVLEEVTMPITFKVVYRKEHFISVLAHRFIQFVAKPDELSLCE